LIAIARSRKTSFNETPAPAPAWAKIGAHTPKNQETPMPITKGFRQLVDEANAQITTYSVAQVRARLDDPKVQIVDIRDVRELEREGTVPGCINARAACWSSGWTRPRPITSRCSATKARNTSCSAARAGAARWRPRR
jgi:hypothetical protein